MIPLDFLNLIQTFLSGKKTYLVTLSAFIALTLGWANKQIDTQKFLEDATGLIIAATVRAGVQKVQTSVESIVPPAVQDDINQINDASPTIPPVKNFRRQLDGD